MRRITRTVPLWLCAMTLPVAGSRDDLAARAQTFAHEVIGVVHDLVLGAERFGALGSRLDLLKRHRPYHESHPVLNITHKLMCRGHRQTDRERLRNNEAYLEAPGVEAIPDSTPAGDFC